MHRPIGGGPPIVCSCCWRGRQVLWGTRVISGGADGLFQLPATGTETRNENVEAPRAPRTR